MRIVGVDLGIRKIAWALWEDGILKETWAFESSAETRQQELREVADTLYSEVLAVEPQYVFIEDTLIGNNRKYSIKLSQTMGAVLAALADRDVYLVNNTTWKKQVVGSGNAHKNTVRNYIIQRSSAYAVLCGYDQDRFDAACIGYYGVLTHQKVEAMEAARSTSS